MHDAKQSSVPRNYRETPSCRRETALGSGWKPDGRASSPHPCLFLAARTDRLADHPIMEAHARAHVTVWRRRESMDARRRPLGAQDTCHSAQGRTARAPDPAGMGAAAILVPLAPAWAVQSPGVRIGRAPRHGDRFRTRKPSHSSPAPNTRPPRKERKRTRLRPRPFPVDIAKEIRIITQDWLPHPALRTAPPYIAAQPPRAETSRLWPR